MADDQTTSEPAVTEKPSEDSDASHPCGPEIAMGTDNKRRRRRLKKKNSSDAVDVMAGETLDEHSEDQTAKSSEASWEPPLTGTEVDETLDQASAGMCSSYTEQTLEGCVSLRADSSPSPPSEETSDSERQGRVRRSRRSSAKSLQQHTGWEAVEKDQKDQQSIPPSSAESRDEGAAAGADLAPWQTDFNLEDVFKPVATRGQRSVRRSLRNQCNADSSGAGLAWLPQTPPESIGGVRRRPRGRRVVAASPSLAEET